MSIETGNAPKLHCPYCGGRQLQVATSTQFWTSTNVTRKMVTTSVKSKSIRYWRCTDCGSTFPFPQDLRQQAETMIRNAETSKRLSVVDAIVGGISLLMISVPLLSFLGAFFLVWAVAMFPILYSLVPRFYREKAEKLQNEYEDLISKCME